MAISRMNIPRQHYGLGSLVKKAVKAVTKPVKQIIKSPIGKAALLGLGAYGLGGGKFFGKGFPGMGQGFSMSNILPNIKGLGTAGKAALGTGAALAFGGGDPTKTEGFDMARRKGNVEEYLRKYYREYMQSDWETGWTQDEEDNFVARYTNEYNQGGRVGFYAGTDEDDLAEFQDDDLGIIELLKDQGIPYGEQVKKEGIKSLDAGAQPIVKTGNYETQDSKLVERYNEHKQEDGTMSFDEFEKFESMTAYGGPFAVLKKLGFKSKDISNLFRNLSQMGKEYKTNENFKHLYKLLANPMDNKEAIIDIMKQYGKKIPKVLKKPRKKRSIGGIMGGRVGLRAMQNLIEDDEEEYAQGGRIGLNEGSTPFQAWALSQGIDLESLSGNDFNAVLQQWNSLENRSQGGRIGYAGGPKKMNQDGLEFIVPVGQSEEKAFYDAIINDVDGIMSEERKSEWLNLLVPQLMESGEMSGAEKEELGMAQGGRIGAFGGGVMGIGAPGMRLPGIPQMAPDGLEYNMKAGGFQPLGSKEGKDDVKAVLAKNEFVMTADAVRGAGGGSIEKGAQRMYDTMKNLESKVG
jgi:hypothetical protein